MAQVKLLKIAVDGIPLENSPIDEVTFASFSVSGGGPVLGVSGLDMTNQDIINIKDLLFTNPATGTINQTVGPVTIDNLMAKDRDNVMGVSGAVLFPFISDVSDQLASFQLPTISGAPTQPPSDPGDGFLVYDSVNDNLYVWTGSAWDNLNTVTSASNVDDETYVAGENLVTGNVVYLSGSNTVSRARADVSATSYVIGFVVSPASTGNLVAVRKLGSLGGFSGLGINVRQYLSGTTLGAITPTIPVATGHTIVQAGYGRTSTQLDIQIQQLGRRA